MDSINFISYIKVYLFINKGYTNAYLIPFYTLLLSRFRKEINCLQKLLSISPGRSSIHRLYVSWVMSSLQIITIMKQIVKKMERESCIGCQWIKNHSSQHKGKCICIRKNLCIYKSNKKSIKTCRRTFIYLTWLSKQYVFRYAIRFMYIKWNGTGSTAYQNLLWKLCWKAIFTFDCGYPSMRLIDQLLQQKQYFLFRVSSVFFKAYLDQVQDGEDR